MSEVGEVVVFEALHQTPRRVVAGRRAERGRDRVKLQLGALAARGLRQKARPFMRMKCSSAAALGHIAGVL